MRGQKTGKSPQKYHIGNEGYISLSDITTSYIKHKTWHLVKKMSVLQGRRYDFQNYWPETQMMMVGKTGSVP